MLNGLLWPGLVFVRPISGAHLPGISRETAMAWQHQALTPCSEKETV